MLLTILLTGYLLGASIAVYAAPAPGGKSPAKPVAKAAAPSKPTTSAVPTGYNIARFVLPPATYLSMPRRISQTSALPLKVRGPVYLPKGAANIALHKPVSSSDDKPAVGTLAMITDGDKQATRRVWADFGSVKTEMLEYAYWVGLASGTQWVQIDLQGTHAISGILLWHYYGESRVYRDVVIQVADDADFVENLQTVYNNDGDNSSGLGIGTDREFYESHQGQWIPLPSVKARFVRLYSQGNTSDPKNDYTEVEVWGLLAKAQPAPSQVKAADRKLPVKTPAPVRRPVKVKPKKPAPPSTSQPAKAGAKKTPPPGMMEAPLVLPPVTPDYL